MNLSDSLQQLLQQGQILATQRKHTQLENIHLLSVLPKTAPDIFENLKQAGIATFRFEKWIHQQLDAQPLQQSHIQEPMPSRSLTFCLTHAQSQKMDQPIQIMDYLHSLFHTQSSILQSLEQLGLDLNHFTASEPQDSEEDLPPYFINFTQKAKQGQLDPVIGREQEIERVMQILSRRTKNNPILIGEPGVGKTAIVEGLAQSIEQKLAPEPLWSKTVLGLDMTALIAGAKYRGEFEERLKKVMDYLEKYQDEFLIFIDEIHMLVGAGKTDGAMDAANILKPALARGSLHCIGATTLDEYRTGIEKDPALERRFQKVFVQEPNEEQTLSILRGIKERYEQHHNIKISDAALSAAVELSVRYINDRFLPDKAIDLIDEAASKIKLDLVSKPQNLRELETRLHHFQMELIGLQEDKTKNAERIAFVEQQIVQLNEQQQDLIKTWTLKKQTSQQRSELESQIAQSKLQMEQALRSAEYEKASQLQYAKIPELQKQLQQILDQTSDSASLVEPIHIVQCISKATGIPEENIQTTNHKTLANLEQILNQKIQGQERVIKNVSNTLRRAHFGISDPLRPKASFLFVGPTGVGKTFLAKTLAQLLFSSEKNLLRFDMSEFMDKHSVSKLIGAPPGYIGYDQAGQLTEAVRRRPYQVILFDEIEKAHPDVLNILLQLLDDGILTDGQGRTVNFKNTIIIMTTNLCAQTILEHQHKDPFLIEQIVQTEMQKYLRPEFFNRIDSIETFTALAENTISKIIQTQIDQLQERLAKNHLDVSFDSSIIDLIEGAITNAHLGARPIKRALQQIIENPLAHALSKGLVQNHLPIYISQNLGKIKITN